MLIEINSRLYKHFFPSDPHPFLSEAFIMLNKNKADRIVRLTENQAKKEFGLIAGEKNGFLLSPFSAPFGGFHFRKENIYVSRIESFTDGLQEYISSNHLKGIKITLPPEIYNFSVNAKVANVLLRKGFIFKTPDITNWVALGNFDGEFSEKNAKEYYRQALRNKLIFKEAHEEKEKQSVYNLIKENREQLGRPIFMTFDEVIKTSGLWPSDFFKVEDEEGNLLSSAIFYRNLPSIAYAVFWGDSITARPFRAMDFMAFKIFSHYKAAGFRYIDLGISTEDGIPNEGLLRFKESHDSTSSLRYTFTWKPDKNSTDVRSRS